MTTLIPPQTTCKSAFDAVADPFLQYEGLPFNKVLDAESIRRVFNEEDALFAQDRVFSTDYCALSFSRADPDSLSKLVTGESSRPLERRQPRL